MEDAFAESYNNKNTDSIKYYSEDAVSFSNGKCLGRKKAIHESMKVNYSPSRKDQNRIRNARNTCFKRWKYGSGNWGYNVTDSTNTKPTAVIL
jgi:hypothetical protein